MVGAGADRGAALPEGQDRTTAIRHRDHAAHSLPAAMVRLERPGDGRGAARRTAVPRVRATRRRHDEVARRDHHASVPPSAGALRPGGGLLRRVNDILQANGLMTRIGTAVDATLIAAPRSTKNADGERDPEMKQTKKGNQWYFGTKAHIGVDSHSGLLQ